jgi:hypothetical protein
MTEVLKWSRTFFAMLALGASFPALASEWFEQKDAGQLQKTAQQTSGIGSLAKIHGTIAVGNDIDGFLVHIPDLAQFSASTLGGADFDTQLFLFTMDGIPVLANDDKFDQAGNMKNEIWIQQSRIQDEFASGGGCFLLMVGAFNHDPRDKQDGLLFFDEPFTALRNGRPGAGALFRWEGPDSTETAFPESYTITLTGASFCEDSGTIPEPATAAIFAIGLGLTACARRRKFG